MSGDGGVFIGIEIGGTKLQLVAGDGSGRIRGRVRHAVDRGAGGPAIQRRVEAGLAQLAGEGGRVVGVGVGFGGPVDWQTGRVCRSHQIAGWDGFPLRDWLASLVGGSVRIAVENDANAAALAEAVVSLGGRVRTVFYCNFGSGVGGGLVSGGAVYHGAPPGEMEFGHLRLGRGEGETVESRCSGWAVDARVREECARAPRDSALARLVARDPGGEARHLAAALAAGDAVAEGVLCAAASDIAFALSHVVHLAHPDAIVLGGGLSLLGEPLRAAVADALPPLVMAAFHPVPAVRLAALGEDAVPVGALLLAGASSAAA
jgi:glucokinase